MTTLADPSAPTTRRSAGRSRRELHPGAWWLWALGLAAGASFTLNPFLLLATVAIAGLVVAACRGDAPWALSFRYYLYFGLLIVVMRVVFRIVLGGGSTPADPVLFHLPEIPLPEAARGIQLLGDVTVNEVLVGAYDGMRLAALIICVGAANSLANPKRLLASAPPALYEVGAALVVAVSVFPQLAESVRRVNRARKLRGDASRGTGAMHRVVIPVLEDALDRSMTLAAGMDARGYGRSGSVAPRERFVTGVLMLLGLFGLSVGTYGYLDGAAPKVLTYPMLVAGLVFAVLALRSAGRRVHRTRYRPMRWLAAEYLTAGSGIAVAIGFKLLSTEQVAVLYPDVPGWPPLSVASLLVVALAIAPVFVAPQAPVSHDEVGGERA
ncbi:energy-coupling factor transporter transmembrane component T [Aeromicrobium duanguangcaii]|uniref:Energy-coupling factor transporter transmembrane protein EcfT n=1 Tax=Aeromicrobium duanguangcaii TaxID=2968086 RepID=A0ABY5KCN7_9ACTN|nr:energy-coupling factor transporter transmembrane component T [Aeromicrobium duanguangcaii]MCD9155129.1 energy-coupling factor transporter transmembrane protein EcfT [Aeromicrobium duanguangcaii]UUI68217.1 energy-coupling factor transporter transmembrane protein EcfT [Aeromicrobium duanguangcaii]